MTTTSQPHPGDGWELLAEGTPLKEGDEYFLKLRSKWIKPSWGTPVDAIAEGYYWRRRIAQPAAQPEQEPFAKSSSELLAWTDKYKAQPAQGHTPWCIEYDNDTGSSDDCFYEWWNVTDGPHSFECKSEHEAQYLCESLNSHASLIRERDELRALCEEMESSWPVWLGTPDQKGFLNRLRAALANTQKGGQA